MAVPNNAQAYPGLTSFTDPKHQQSIRLLWDRIHSLEGRSEDTGVTFRANPNLGGVAASSLKGLKITNAADPVDPGDYVTKRYADVTYAGEGLRLALTLGNPALTNLTPLLTNSGGGILAGLHVNRPNPSVAVTQGATLYLETDRAAIYQIQNNSWILVATYVFEKQGAAAPADLGANDAGFLYMNTDTGITYQWSGALAHLHQGILRDTFANRPAAFVGCDAGMLFYATDQPYQQMWILDYAAFAWILLVGVGGPGSGTLAAIPTASLGAHDAGFTYIATDFNREYVWTGAAWQDAQCPDARKQIAWFAAAPDTTGWALCDGSTVTISKPDATTTSFVTPDLITNNRVIRAANAAGGTGGASTHTHSVDPPNTTSGNESADQTVQSGAGATVPAAPHTHDTNIGSFTSGSASSYPSYYEALPYIRL